MKKITGYFLYRRTLKLLRDRHHAPTIIFIRDKFEKQIIALLRKKGYRTTIIRNAAGISHLYIEFIYG